jgi:phosphoenolpyruvate carboxykinase (GTP)
MRLDDEGRLRAINPEAGFFGVAPGTSEKTNLNAIRTLHANCIYTNVGLTDDGDVWWEGLTDTPPAHLIDWTGQDWTPQSGRPAAHPNARFTAPAHQDPAIAPEWEDPAGVPIDAIMFGGRRTTIVPLVREAFDWENGVFMGSIMSSETTAAAFGEVGKLRFDPFGMLPFCGYNMGDYWQHWLDVGTASTPEKLPRIYYVNWFRRDAEGRFLWPGFGENSRVLEWIFRRCDGQAAAHETPIGWLPTPGDLDTSGLQMDAADLEELLRVDGPAILAEMPQFEDHYARFGDRLPAAVAAQLETLRRRLEEESPGA